MFNLGHGVLPNTPLEHVQELARYVHRVSSQQSTTSSASHSSRRSAAMIVIIGGGITGLAAAFELARRNVAVRAARRPRRGSAD